MPPSRWPMRRTWTTSHHCTLAVHPLKPGGASPADWGSGPEAASTPSTLGSANEPSGGHLPNRLALSRRARPNHYLRPLDSPRFATEPGFRLVSDGDFAGWVVLAHHEQQLVLGEGYLKPVDARLESWSALQFTDSPVRLNDPRPRQALRCHVVAAKRLEMRRGTWRGRQRGRLPFSAWAAEWWDTWAADDPSPTTLAATESWLQLDVRPWFADRPIDKITPADVRRWQAQLARTVGPSTVAHCRSLALRIFQIAMDEGAIDANPVRKVPPLKRRVDPERVFGEVKRRALTPEEAGRLLACFPLFWWDHVLTLLGTGLRFGELAGLRRRRVHLNRPMPVLEVGPTRYEAGRFGSGFKPRPKSDAGIRPVSLAPLVVESIRRQVPPGNDPEDLVFTGPGGGPGRPGGPNVPRGTRTVLSRHNLHRTYQGAVAKLADPAVPLRPTARRLLRALREGGPQRVEQLAV